MSEPFPPLAYSWWVLLLGLGLMASAGLLILAGRLGWLERLSVDPGGTPAPTPPALPQEPTEAELRERYLEKLATLQAAHANGPLSAREFHLEVAALIRDFGVERHLGAADGTLRSMTSAEAAAVFPGTRAAALLARCQAPSFSEKPEADVATTVALAREVIATW